MCEKHIKLLTESKIFTSMASSYNFLANLSVLPDCIHDLIRYS